MYPKEGGRGLTRNRSELGGNWRKPLCREYLFYSVNIC
jgi:hypothetical protein